MRRNGLFLPVFALLALSVLTVSAQPPTDEQPPTAKSPVPQTIRYCWAQMNPDNESLELLLPAHPEIKTKTFYDVSLPVIHDAGRKEYRTERREQTRIALQIRFARCNLDVRKLAVYQSDGKRLSTQEIADHLAKPYPVVLSDSRPDDMMRAVLADDCVVIVVSMQFVKFQLPDTPDK